ncbi:probable G-protein coupled receptor 34 [Hydractinia symbiolongicarpus]|uniref:probable G-protein coupled receptor 34 n=1 Tax=Hydractinia symbiolongicarpus TaxID=13093 RepID=UPI00254CB817|nr:probable G-protein coupled receptor 34 [Hydractinia symbiolongicarpus]
MATDYLFWTNMIFLVIGLSLNAFGIYCLVKYQQCSNKHNVLLINLSLIEIIKCTIYLLYLPIISVDMSVNVLFHVIVQFLLEMTSIAFGLTLVFILADRFLCVFLHIKYKQKVTMFRLKVACLLCWFVGILATSPILILHTYLKVILNVYHLKVSPVISIFLLLLTICVYTYITYKIKLSRQCFHVPQSHKEQRMINKKQFIIPCIIIMSFILCVGVPNMLHFVSNSYATEHADVINKIGELLWIINFTSDPVVYIFLNKNIRRIALGLVCK